MNITTRLQQAGWTITSETDDGYTLCRATEAPQDPERA